ncbi:MAG: hypothetical protein AAF413_01030 [Patescibacteria group bacterium]
MRESRPTNCLKYYIPEGWYDFAALDGIDRLLASQEVPGSKLRYKSTLGETVLTKCVESELGPLLHVKVLRRDSSFRLKKVGRVIGSFESPKSDIVLKDVIPGRNTALDVGDGQFWRMPPIEKVLNPA